MPSPLNVDRSLDANASPRSLASHDSHDGLMSSRSPAMERTFSYEEGPEKIDHAGWPPASKTMPRTEPPSPSYDRRQQKPPSQVLKRSSVYANKRGSTRDSGLMHDEDARLVMDSINAGRRLDRQSGGYQDSDDDDNPSAALVSRSKHSPALHTTGGAQQYTQLGNQRRPPGPFVDGERGSPSNPWHESSTNTTPRAKKPDMAYQDERSMFDHSPPLFGRRAPPPRPNVHPLLKPPTSNKIMTPAQFERYRKEQEMNHTVSPQTDDEASDDASDNDEDEDEAEHNKQLARQRRKQEAHLAVYRQQMMKVTGEQPSDLPSIQLRPSMDKSSQSAPNAQDRASVLDLSFEKPKEDSKGSDEEDENVPLGVLAAHGFPSKNRPPTAMSGGDSRIQYKSESYPPPPPASTSGASQVGRGSGLPPFAKNLPQDPYYGASLVNPSNREPLALGHPGSGAAHGVSQPNMPPGGLVGVIAGEERARAARRGSPNAQGNYGSPLPPGMTQMPGMPPGMPPMMTAGEQATVQMSEQMTQMMQMQMQWMQQMQQMMAQGMQFPPGQAPPMTPQQPQMMGPTSHNLTLPTHPQRPLSSGHNIAPGTPGGQQHAGRSMSMMGTGQPLHWPPHQGNNRQSGAPSMMSAAIAGGPSAGYTPSIAPSERSNVGMPSRYRPVSVAPADERHSRSHSRSSTFTSGTLQLPAYGRDSRLSRSGDRRSNLSLRPLSQPPPKKTSSDDDDDEEGWEEMKKKRESKKSLWRLTRKKDDQASAGLEYYDYSET